MEVMEEFKQHGRSIEEITKMFDIQPIPTAKMILSHQGYSKSEVKKLFNVSEFNTNPERYADTVSNIVRTPEHRSLIRRAFELDNFMEEQRLQSIEAMAFEKEMSVLLSALGIEHLTEKQLRKRYLSERVTVLIENIVEPDSTLAGEETTYTKVTLLANDGANKI